MSETESAPVVLTGVSEVVLRKRKTLVEIKAKRQAQQKPKAPKKKITFRRAEEFVRDHRARAKDTMRVQRVVKRQTALVNAGKPLTPDGKLALVIRVFPTKGTCMRTRKVLQHLRLWQLYSAVFIMLNEKTIAMLKQVEPYVTWGTPSLKTTRDLITKRGFAKVNKQRLAITDNAMIERELGEQGIVCTEDIVHEIATVGENFKVANAFLWPIKLSTPKSGFDPKKYKAFSQGGDYGDRGEKINDLVLKMN